MRSTELGIISTRTSSIPAATSLSLNQQLLLAETTSDRINLLRDDSQFVFDFNQSQNESENNGEFVVASRGTFPALIGTGTGMAVGRIGPCGLHKFHVHPRSAELQLVVQGRLVTEMVSGNNADGTRRVIRNEIGPYQMTPFYQGSVHTQFNPDCTNVTFVSSFASEDFGTEYMFDQLFAFSDDVIGASFGQMLAAEDVDILRREIPASVAFGVKQCLQQCNPERIW
ncbi:spherulin-1B [Stachybotrys elegans]|uniref:Spherulin-1B n=1 Tax=Stachybotrys elegans TaxID=80388 RepID=A0A8K0WJJ8_9HYPO|nr:spherulin-1B [Stachybotrys elegans]